MGNTITIDDGLKTYDIVNKSGKLLGQFSFNPSDTGLINRYKEVSANIIDLGKRLSKENGTNEEKNRIAEDFIKEQFDYLFNTNISETFFSIMGPLSLLGDQTFTEVVMNAVANVVKKESGVHLKKLEMRINKHTSKYHG